DTYRKVERMAGLERARHVAAAHAAAVAFVRQVVAEERIECELEEVEGAVWMDGEQPGRGKTKDTDIAAARALREELAACCCAGVVGAHIEFRQRACGDGEEMEETLVLPGCINLHPVKYLQ
ncbi:hypothetical protein Vretifemale_2480, partial [Volvox reticuliferus]